MLGEPYRHVRVPMGEDYEGPVVCSVVSRYAEQRPARGAVLHVHGFCDYFFQTHVADFFVDLGYDFHAVDLRKYGRSLLPHQTPNFCLELEEYFPDLDAAIDLIRTHSDVRRVVLHGHSTGGLIAALWAAQRADEGRPVAEALVLNSPWLDLQGSVLLRTIGTQALDRLGPRRPYAVIPRRVSQVYVHTLHRDYAGEWDFDLRWKPKESFPVRAGWLRAVRAGHRRVHRGIDTGVPVLTLCSAQSLQPQDVVAEAYTSDIVLDVDQIAGWSYRLSDQVTVSRVADAVHDVFLSRPGARKTAFDRVRRWLDYAVPSGG